MRTITLNEGRKIIGHTYEKKMCGFVYHYSFYNFLKDVSNEITNYVFFGRINVYKDGEQISEKDSIYNADAIFEEIEQGTLVMLGK